MFKKLVSKENLYQAFRRVKGNGGSSGMDGQTIQQFEARLEKNLQRLHWKLRSESYRPQSGKLVRIPKPGRGEKRPLVIPTVRDRVGQAALYNVLGPLFDMDFHDNSFGFRPGRGTLDALRRTITLLNQGLVYVVDADIKACFDSIPHNPLMELVSHKVQDQRVLNLIRLFLTNGVMEGGDHRYPEEGTPQGAVISPLLANIYLNPLDHLVAKAGHEMVRYADDFVILSHSRAEAEQALSLIKDWMSQAGLSLHPNKTTIVDASPPDGFNFLGYHFQGNLRSPRPENMTRLKGKIKVAIQQHGLANLNNAIPKINQITRGWFQHFQLCNNPQPFQDIDDWTWQWLTTAGAAAGRNKPHRQKPLQRAPLSLIRTLNEQTEITREELKHGTVITYRIKIPFP